MVTFISAILVFSVIILVHEFGHYKMAKKAGIKVEEFAIGMGPLLYKNIKNGTQYSIRAVPIGGYVRMEGEEEDVKSPTSFSAKSVWQRFAVIAAGPIMNFFLALVIFMIMAFVWGVAGTTIGYLDEDSNEYRAGIRSGDKIVTINGHKAHIWEDIALDVTDENKSSYTVEVERDGQLKKYDIEYNYRKLIGITSQMEDGVATTIVSPSDVNSPAHAAGIKNGDRVTSINGQPVNQWQDVTDLVKASGEGSIKVTVDRSGESLSFDIVPVMQPEVRFGVEMEKSFTTAIFSSIYKTGYYIKLMFDFIGMLFHGQVGANDVGGPVMVISMVDQAAKLGIDYLLSLAAFISINLGFMNLLPIPALDGSKLVFLIIEAVRGKAIPAEKEGFIHFIGFVLLISLMIFITYKDILRVFRL